MAEIPRLNGVIRALEQGKTGLRRLRLGGHRDRRRAGRLQTRRRGLRDGARADSAPALRDALQYMLDRRQILDSGTLARR